MIFPWEKYEELPIQCRNTLQVFVTPVCNLHCEGCFARKVMAEGTEINLDEYQTAVGIAKSKGAEQINLLGGEPLMHKNVRDFVAFDRRLKLKTTIYTNGYYLNQWPIFEDDVKLRVSLYYAHGGYKSLDTLQANQPVDICFMVSRKTKVEELLEVVEDPRCRILFISSIRELDNPRHEFFDDTDNTMPVMRYKELVHEFLWRYDGPKEIHVSKRGVFESTINPGLHRCRFANYIPGGKIIQCPYDIVNLRYQEEYRFGIRPCQHNSTCLMSKVIYRRRVLFDRFKDARESVARWPEWKRNIGHGLGPTLSESGEVL